MWQGKMVFNNFKFFSCFCYIWHWQQNFWMIIINQFSWSECLVKYIWILIGNLRLSTRNLKKKKKNLWIPAINLMLEWWCHFIMPSHQHMVTASKLETNQSMNQMIAQVIHMCVLPVKKIWHFSSKFDQHFSLYCGSLKPKLHMGIGY